MVGGTLFVHRKVIQRESLGVLLLNTSYAETQNKQCASTAQGHFGLDNPFALIDGPPALLTTLASKSATRRWGTRHTFATAD